jgi:hypothetical protein
VNPELRKEQLEEYLKSALQIRDFSEDVSSFLGLYDHIRSGVKDGDQSSLADSFRLVDAAMSPEISFTPPMVSSFSLSESGDRLKDELKLDFDKNLKKFRTSGGIIVLDVRILGYEVWSRVKDSKPFAVRVSAFPELFIICF